MAALACSTGGVLPRKAIRNFGQAMENFGAFSCILNEMFQKVDAITGRIIESDIPITVTVVMK